MKYCTGSMAAAKTALSPCVAAVRERCGMGSRWKPVGCLWASLVVPQAPPSRLILGRLPRHPCSLLGPELVHLLVVWEGVVDGLEGTSKSCIRLGEVEFARLCCRTCGSPLLDWGGWGQLGLGP